ncbi:putative uncharacterized protein ENSP00000382790 -like protein [Collichthys lucidus]|uniref:Serine/arginine repetitive matrix protein 2-like n=1 Tax=Collichthys lucidus TaxID=240159 RepID=A0A4U5U247_COLLU|nr:putative uncharacterized protein ENSP00000382790 -like protein [Collichthys lucidus]
METYTVLCPKRLHCISCQGLALGHINNIVKITEVGDGDPPCPVLKREQSPSPPPLSPIAPDINKKTDEKPPSLLHHRQEEEADLMVKDGFVNASHREALMDTGTEEEQECRTPRSSRAEQNPSGTLLQDVVNRFSEKLETIRPVEKDPPSVSTVIYVSERDLPQTPSTSQSLQFHADAHLTEIITTVLHTGSASDYNLSELFNRHDSKEPKSPNTRSRRRQEVLAAIATPADDASTRRQTLQIKRELAMLDQSYSRRKGPSAKRARCKDENTVTTSNTLSDSNLVKEESKREVDVGVEPLENHRVGEGPLNHILTAESDREEVKEEIQTVIVAEEFQIIKVEKKESEIFSEEKDLSLPGTQIPTPELQSKNDKQGSEGDCVQTQAMTVTATSTSNCSKPCKGDSKGSSAGSDRSHKGAPSGQSSDCKKRPDEGKDRCPKGRKKSQSHHSDDSRRSRRNIVPPQRFSSYVTEPRQMFFAACFSGSIFTQKTRREKALTSSTLDALSKDPDAKDNQQESSPLSSPEHTIESTHGEQCQPSFKESNQNQVITHNAPAKEKSPARNISDSGTDGSDCSAKPLERLRSSPKRLQYTNTTSRTPKNTSNMDATIKPAPCVESPPNSQLQYTSPIKLMFVSPVRDKEGVRYSLKSAGSGSSGQAEEPFDPCEESSWSGTPQIHKSQSTKSATSRVKSGSSPLKSATSPARSASSPSKSASSSPKSASSKPKSASSPSKSASSPSKSASSPSKSASSPSKSASSPSKSASSPSKSASSPSKSASSPSKSASSPSKSASSPSKSASSPSKSASSPSKSASTSPKSASSKPKSASSPSKSASTSPKSASSKLKSPSSPSKSNSPAKSASSPSKSASSPAKSASSTPKSASSPRKSSSSPRKSPSSPAKSASSPKSASASPKQSTRRSGEGTPTKRVAGTESHRLSGEVLSLHETTPPKRRPGRPKKLGPQLEQKAKRPIGRPRKEKAVDSEVGAKTVNGKSDVPSDVEENVNKNLKITVVYGRSRRNKRTVSEGFDQLQTEFNDACQAVGLKSDLGILMHNSNTSSGSIKTSSTELPEKLHLANPVKESAPQTNSNIKCQKRDDSVPSRKPGRPAKVKISGISVTVTTVSPRQRKIQINKDTRQSPERLIRKKLHVPEFRSAKEPWTISRQSTSKSGLLEEGVETKDESQEKLPNQPVAVRHSMRVRKPSMHFLHAVATSMSRSYSHSNALLRRSKQLLLNKASNERKQAELQSSVQTLVEKRPLCGQEQENISQDLNRVASMSVDSIFTPKETLKWWAASAEENTMNQELARRIRHISDTWVSDTVESQEKEIALNSKLGTKGNRKSKQSSVVRTLFDCPPNKPRSCSMQQLCSWFMQTTETQSLGIVKKASSRNPYELMHFPRSTNNKSVCHSPQAERLRKHIKKFAKTVPKSPLQHQQAQRRLRKRNEGSPSTHNVKRQLFALGFATSQRAQWKRSRAFLKYQTTLFRARTRFLTRRERERWRKRQRNKKNIKEPVDVPKEQNLCSKAWSPETLKECRVFLRKINSPDNESTEEEWDSCTVTLDNGSPSAYLFAGRTRELKTK